MNTINTNNRFILFVLFFYFVMNPMLNSAAAKNSRRMEGKASATFGTMSLNEIGGWQFGPHNEIAIDEADSLAFLNSGGVVLIFDISDFTSPVLISDTIRTEGKVYALTYDPSTHHLYVSLGLFGIEIWDVQNINSPQLLSSLQLNYAGTNPGAGEIVFHDGFLYVAAGYAGVVYVNATDPENPFQAGYYAPESIGTLDIDDSGSHIVASSGQETYLFNIQANGSISLAATNYFFGGGGLHIHSNYVYEVMPGSQGIPSTMYILQLSTLGHLGSVSLPGTQTVGYQITSSANNLYVTDPLQGVDIYSLSNPASPAYLSYFPTPTRTLEYYFGHVFLADYAGMKIIDVSDPSSPALSSSYVGEGGTVRKVKVLGNYCYLLSFEKLYVLDVSDPMDPVLAGTNEPASGIDLYLTVRGNYAYITNTDLGLQVVNISDPANPETVWTSSPASYNFMTSEDNYLYIIDSLNYLRIFDISNPIEPNEMGSLMLDGPAYLNTEIAASNSYVYITTDLPGSLKIIDVSDPSNPTLISQYTQYVDLWGVDVENGYAYTADEFGYPSAIVVFNISDPSDPVIAGSLEYYSPPPEPWKTHAYGNTLYVGDIMDPYISLVDISDPNQPVEITSQLLADKFAEIDVTENYVYIGTSEAGLHIYENPVVTAVHDQVEPKTIPTEYALLQNYPNPFNPTTTIAYDVKKSGQVQLRIYNALGQLVRMVVNEQKSAGSYLVRWDGKDDHGRELPSGNYFYQLRVNGFATARHMVKLK